MFSRFFIDRPIFAFVISIFIVIAGLAAMRALPIAQSLATPEHSPESIVGRITLAHTLQEAIAGAQMVH